MLANILTGSGVPARTPWQAILEQQARERVQRLQRENHLRGVALAEQARQQARRRRSSAAAAAAAVQRRRI